MTWFTGGGRLGVTESRIDLYQRRPGTTVGVKRRDGFVLEVKVLQRNGRVVSLSGGLTGTCQEWRKWRPVSAVGEPWRGTWIDVHKSIVTRSYALARDGGALPVDEPDHRRAGCDVELVAVRVGDVEAWGYAFEAYGPRDRRDAALQAAGEAITATTPYPPGFAGLLANETGYPGWLDALPATQRATTAV